ncbi:tricarballylate utilization 4Fe-4S protein TcuB [Paraburkholderia terricola]|uniref:Citrate/tricarballylate utilization protein n=1 Tax=Paraburkholderia terricola TaxID=169427 RepID=A0A1M6T3Y3_9BURK|nr:MULTISPECIES: tricarballylate utilization 4Fe-4S protein TcuB [Paraburkholderia]SDO70285.1 citrate/tricarballylate utilization protein [Paraburkholderia sediminicola]SHK51713.1 citrate/tricarballylate utilization protein [Paraburkholderia terricola]
MQSLEALAREARALAENQPVIMRGVALSESEGEVSRIMQICNACRYCEGFCAVFPAMTRRLEFGRADVHFLANLCHNCGACLHSCQYAPPHEFSVNVPQAMAQVRVNTYTEYAWPKAFGVLYKRNGVTIAFALVAALTVFLALLSRIGPQGGESVGANFYAIFPHNFLAMVFGAVFLFSAIALGIGVRRFWRDEDPGDASLAAALETTKDVLTLRYLGGGHGDGCNNEDDAFSLKRRRLHHLTFYGFMLCFASTCVATLYHYLFSLEAPYAYTSLPVVLGTVGGVSLLLGTCGLLWLNVNRNPLHGDPGQKPMDRAFIVLLILVALTGLVLVGLRSTALMPTLLTLHLGTVMALFMTLPYGKFAHGIYRTAALLKWAIEKRRPSNLLVEE